MTTHADEPADVAAALTVLSGHLQRDPDELRELLRPPTMREVVEAATRSPMADLPPLPRTAVGRAVEAATRNRHI